MLQTNLVRRRGDGGLSGCVDVRKARIVEVIIRCVFRDTFLLEDVQLKNLHDLGWPNESIRVTALYLSWHSLHRQ